MIVFFKNSNTVSVMKKPFAHFLKTIKNTITMAKLKSFVAYCFLYLFIYYNGSRVKMIKKISKLICRS